MSTHSGATALRRREAFFCAICRCLSSPSSIATFSLKPLRSILWSIKTSASSIATYKADCLSALLSFAILMRIVMVPVHASSFIEKSYVSTPSYEESSKDLPSGPLKNRISAPKEVSKSYALPAHLDLSLKRWIDFRALLIWRISFGEYCFPCAISVVAREYSESNNANSSSCGTSRRLSCNSLRVRFFIASPCQSGPRSGSGLRACS